MFIFSLLLSFSLYDLKSMIINCIIYWPASYNKKHANGQIGQATSWNLSAQLPCRSTLYHLMYCEYWYSETQTGLFHYILQDVNDNCQCPSPIMSHTVSLTFALTFFCMSEQHCFSSCRASGFKVVMYSMPSEIVVS